jgi:general secretion pathway protein E
MPDAVGEPFRRALAGLDARQPTYVVALVDLLLDEAQRASASDVHLQPTPDALEMRWRIDGVLHHVAALPASLAPNVAARLKVIADLLTYRTDTPQEGRIRGAPGTAERRVSTFPTVHGEKVVVRLFADAGRYSRLADLGLPDAVRDELSRVLEETAGLVVVAGPAGAGKTTTLYACLRELVERHEGRRSLASLEDPVESLVSGVAQSQVHPPSGFDLATGLRSLMRQDPEVIAVGEMRDRATAEAALGAALTGHLVLTTFHAGGAAGAVGRLLDMGLEPYILRSGVLAVLAQRLLRRLCECAGVEDDASRSLGLPVRRALRPVGCATCGHTGYRGRFVLTELLMPGRGAVAHAILARQDVDAIESAAIGAGMVPWACRAIEAVESGHTSPAEVRRALGLGPIAPRGS